MNHTGNSMCLFQVLLVVYHNHAPKVFSKTKKASVGKSKVEYSSEPWVLSHFLIMDFLEHNWSTKGKNACENQNVTKTDLKIS